jgi:Na+-transporting methylmalonyl-CoA/oxaloacetate decarboxylase beta subunit
MRTKKKERKIRLSQIRLISKKVERRLFFLFVIVAAHPKKKTRN